MAEEIQREKENEINNVYSIMEPGLKNFDDSFSTLQSPRNKQFTHKRECKF